MNATGASGRDPVPPLVRALDRALRQLGALGHPVQASRLAADSWALLRRERPKEAERLTGLLHYLAHLEATSASADPKPLYEPTQSEEDRMSSDERTLDVRSEAPARRHELIFETYAALPSGEHFVLVNDHDPKPLYYQFAAEYAGEFTWEYLQQGPQAWEVRIGRVALPDTAKSGA